jgi:hypothetical protein
MSSEVEMGQNAAVADCLFARIPHPIFNPDKFDAFDAHQSLKVTDFWPST